MSNAVPAGWSDGTLTDFCDINPRLAQRAEMNADTPVSFIKMEDVSNNAVVRNVRVAPYGQVSKGFTSFQNGDVLVAKITPCFENGKGGFVQGLRNGVGFGSTEFHVLRARKDSNSEFLYQFTNSEDFRLKGEANMTGSAGQRRVPTEYLKTLDVIFPPLPEQQKIAAILSSVDDVIEKTRAQIDKLKHLKTGMMQELLTKGIGSGGVPHTEFKDSPVGRIPKEWHAVLLDEVAARGSGHTPRKSKPEYWNGGVNWVSLSDTNKLDRLYVTTTAKQISELGLKNSSAVIHPPGTVVLSRDAGIGKSGITTKEMAVSQHFIAWRCSERLDNHFLYYVLQHWKPRFEAIAMGSTIKTIGLSFFKQLHIPIPPASEQKAIAGTLKSIDLKIFCMERKLNAVGGLKKALMQDLLTGKVRVNFGENETAVA